MSELTVEKIPEILLEMEQQARYIKNAPYKAGKTSLLATMVVAEREIIDFLLAEIERIEKQTAEKCIKLTEDVVGNGTDFIEDVIANDIRKHFTLPPPPE